MSLHQQSFCLKWEKHQDNVTSTFKELLAEEDFVDITLTADGGALKAHKVVLSACSPYFREILRGISAWQHPVIVLKDVPFLHLQGIVEYIYHGEVSVTYESLTAFLKTAQLLRVKGLVEDANAAGANNNQVQKKHHSRKSSRPIRTVIPSKRPLLDNGDAANSANQSEEEVVPITANFNTKLSQQKFSDVRKDEDNNTEEEEIDDVEEDEEEEEEPAPYGMDQLELDKRQRQQKHMTGIYSNIFIFGSNILANLFEIGFGPNTIFIVL